MGKITILPDTLCNQIAAGEVVERPAAAVKELLENSIDAGARRVSLSLLQGGRREIRVVDDGSGMHPDDALLAVERHATSKIRSVEDLQAVSSLGFRGEALPSIAAVSRFELATREPDAVSGVIVRIEGGILRDVRETGCPPGTMVTVRDLFYNIPARRKFLRSVDTELAHINDQLLRLAIARPDIHFQLHHDERRIHDFPRARALEHRAAQILGPDVAKRLRPFSHRTPVVHVHGLAAPADIQRAGSQHLIVFVNGRAVWDRVLNRAVTAAYESLLPRGRFPLAIVFVDIEPELVDVNVHPTKKEVRLRNPGETVDAVRIAVRGALCASRPAALSSPAQAFPRRGIESAPHLNETQVSMDVFPQASAAAAAPSVRFQPSFDDVLPSAATAEDTGSPLPDSGSREPVSFARLPLVGQVANMYILLEAPDGLVIIDQHAAHERILFDRLTSSPSREPGQRLLKSAVLDLMPREAAALRRWTGRLKDIGFDIEPFGGDSFVVHAVPSALGSCPPDLLVREFLASAHEDENAPSFEPLTALVKTAACHQAVRAGRRMKPDEIRHLLEQLDLTPFGSTCPHGRPLWHKLTHAEIARMFHRT